VTLDFLWSDPEPPEITLDFSCSEVVLGLPVASAVPTLRAVLLLVVSGRPASIESTCMLLRSV
jgi:hypothetical protein